MKKQGVVALLMILLLVGIVWTMSRQPPPRKQGVSPPVPAAQPIPKAELPQSVSVPMTEQAPPPLIRNPFRLPDGLVKILRAEYRRMQEELLQQQQQGLPISAPAPAEKPEETFKLQGVFWGTPRPQAIINRQVLFVGDQIKGAKVVSISKEGVTLLLSGKEILLKPTVPEQVRNKEAPYKNSAIPGYR